MLTTQIQSGWDNIYINCVISCKSNIIGVIEYIFEMPSYRTITDDIFYYSD